MVLTEQGTASRRFNRTEAKSVRELQLIKATIECIAKHGLTGTTLAKVTEVAGSSLGFVNFHFKSKERLLEATLKLLAVEHHSQWQKDVEEPGLSDIDRLLRIADSHFYPRICSRKKLAVWFAFFGEANNRGAYRKIVDDIDDERFAEIFRLCQSIKAEGNYSEIDPKQVAMTLEGLFDGLWLNMLLYPDLYTTEISKKQVHIFLAAMFPRHFGRSMPCNERTA